MVAYEAVPFIFYAENQFTTNATYYDQVAFQLVKTYHYVVVDRQGIRPGDWYITSECSHGLRWYPTFLSVPSTANYRAYPAYTPGLSHKPSRVEPELAELSPNDHDVGSTPLPKSLLKSRHVQSRWQLRLRTWLGRH